MTSPLQESEVGRGFVVRSCEDRGQPRYYRDTRGEAGHGGCSDIFDSSIRIEYATVYPTRAAARRWAREFLGCSPYTIAPASSTTAQEERTNG